MSEANGNENRGRPADLDMSQIQHDRLHHTSLPQTRISQILDKLLIWIGAGFSALWVVVVGVIVWAVISRYVFSLGTVMLEELQWHLAGAAWLVGLSYTLVHDEHVRVDVLHEMFSLRTQTWIELFGILFLLIPFLVIAMAESLPYAMSSLELNERSPAPDGLPARWIMKMFLPISMGLLLLAAISRLLKTTALLFGFPRPIRVEE